jgi:hypothetical protein
LISILDFLNLVMKKLIFLLTLIFVWLFLMTGAASANPAYLPKADLIRGTGPEVYVLENGTRRWIPDPETFEYFRYKWANVKTISDALLSSYPQGDNLDRYDDYPEGTLLRGTGPEVYLVEAGQRRWFPNPRIFEGNNFGWRYIYQIDDDKLNKIEQGDNITLSETNQYPETIILQGPTEEEILETAEVTFKYSGTNPLGETADLSFETYLVGDDTDWRRQYGDTKTYDLSEGNGVYTFYVRAKNEQGYYDPTPAKRSFRIGVSSYYQKVEISRVEPDEINFKNDYLVLRNNKDQLIDITGWTIRTKRETATIPQAVEKLRHPLLDNYDSDIKLAYRNEVIISTGLSPQGVNFRVNKCTGYLDQSSQFYPSLDENCPRLEESSYSSFKKSCRDFIKGLNRCEIPDYSDKLAVSSDSQCTSFLSEKLNYKQCYLDHRQEVDFFEDEWRVFLNRSTDILDNDGDTIILRDKNGLVVDEYEY